MKTTVGVGLLSLVLASPVLGQSSNPFQAPECRKLAESSARNLNRVTSKTLGNAIHDDKARPAAIDNLLAQVRDSERLKIFLECLSARQANSKK